MGHDVVLHPVLLSPVSCPIYHTEALYVLDALVTASPHSETLFVVPTHDPESYSYARNAPQRNATQRQTQRNAMQAATSL